MCHSFDFMSFLRLLNFLNDTYLSAISNEIEGYWMETGALLNAIIDRIHLPWVDDTCIGAAGMLPLRYPL